MYSQKDAEVKHRQNSFVVDKSLKKTFRTSGSDYKHSSDFKIDRGHLIPAGNHIKHADEYNRTFFYWNIFPQNSYLNRGAWLTAEHLARDLVRIQGIDKLYVYSGTLFLTKSEQMMGSFKRFYVIFGIQKTVLVYILGVFKPGITGKTNNFGLVVPGYLLFEAHLGLNWENNFFEFRIVPSAISSIFNKKTFNFT